MNNYFDKIVNDVNNGFRQEHMVNTEMQQEIRKISSSFLSFSQ